MNTASCFSRVKTHQELTIIEGETLGLTHAQVGGELAAPMETAAAVGGSHCVAPFGRIGDGSDAQKIGRNWSGWRVAVPMCLVDEDAAHAIADVRQGCAELYKLSEADCDALLDEIGKRTKEVAPLFDINISGGRRSLRPFSKGQMKPWWKSRFRASSRRPSLRSRTSSSRKKAITDGLTRAGQPCAL